MSKNILGYIYIHASNSQQNLMVPAFANLIKLIFLNNTFNVLSFKGTLQLFKIIYILQFQPQQNLAAPSL